MTEPYKGYNDACRYWDSVRAHPDFAKRASGGFICLPPPVTEAQRALSLLRSIKDKTPGVMAAIAALEG